MHPLALRKQLAEAKRAVEAERIALHKQLADVKQAADAERAVLQKQLAEAKQIASAAAFKPSAKIAPSTDYADNALLRERINDVAAEVARLTMELEGPNSPIEAILAKESDRAHRRERYREGQERLRRREWRNRSKPRRPIRALQQRSARQRAPV